MALADPIDFFGLQAATHGALVAISSNVDNAKNYVAAINGGRYSSGVNQSSAGVWRSPTVVYSVVKDLTLALQLGKAFAANISGGVMTESGYMLSEVRVATRAGQFPVVTVSAAANEGADAINLFSLSIPIVARAKAQNLLGALADVGHLQRCEIVAACDPVVVEENLMPCASDVVGGRFDLDADILVLDSASVPGVSSAGFALLGRPQGIVDGGYTIWNVRARKEIV